MSTVKDLGAVSAYALAVKYGYVGTEEEWVNEQEAKRKQAVEAASSAAINAATATQAASEAKRAAENAMSDKDAAAQSAAKAKTYAENAEAITGIEIAKKDRAGIVKGGENHIAEDGTLQLTVTTTERTIQDSYAGGVKINEIDGASEQVITTGAQLYDAHKYTGASATVDDDGWYTVTYDNKGSTEIAYRNISVPASDLLLPNTEYLIVVEIESISNAVLQAVSSSTSSMKGQFTETRTYTTVGTKTAIVMTRDSFEGCLAMTRTYVGINAGTIGSVKYRISVISDTSITADTFKYEPFTGNAPSPSPDYPQEIESVVVGEIKTVGKNLLPNNAISQTINGVTFTVSDDGSVSISGTPTARTTIYYYNNLVLPAGNYVISQGGASNGACLYLSYEKDGVLDYIDLYSDSYGAKLFTLSKETTLNARLDCRDLNVSVNTTLYPMLREASIEDVTYEPYQESVIALSTPITLHGIGDVKDRIVRKDGVFGVERNFAEVVFDGSDDEGWKSVGTENGGTRYSTILPNAKVSDTSNGVRSLNSNSNITRAGGTYYNTNCYTIDNNSTLYCVLNRVETLDEFKAKLVESLMTIVYELAESTFESLPIADQIALHNLKSFDTATYISTDSEIEPVIEVECGTSKVGGYSLDAWNTAKRNEIALANLTSAVLALNQE